ncbi:hypothetical protein [Arthrobacter sp. FW306-04-A]|uniref:hypothetical protein n=1 Tax=Arthrobacter sp. FW306-04-A TaxID=2879619 RepID=UPI0037C1526E|nr:hypothetical protein LFT43_14790 [Arthrobacter sp. FW306-04-A]
MPVAAAALLLGACSQPAAQSGPAQSLTTAASPGAPDAKTGTPPRATGPACDLVTPEIAARIGPGLAGTGHQGADAVAVPSGSPVPYQHSFCTYFSKAADGYLGLSVDLVTPAPKELLALSMKTPGCLPVDGVGDFACERWSEPPANAPTPQQEVDLISVRAGSTLKLSYTASGKYLRDAQAMGQSVAELARDAGWGTGSPITVPVPPGPVVSPPALPADTSTCGYVGVDRVQQAFGAAAPGHATAAGGSCFYNFSTPDSVLQFDVTVNKNQTPGQIAEFTAQNQAHYQPVSGVADAAWIFILTLHDGPGPTTTVNITALKGKDTASFTLHATASRSGASTEQLRQQLIKLAGSIDF